ncbi:peptide/nickel transport system permease protein [Saccharopolyspora phatthalungensis]|uniref:Peptide/nickel transport system permease protein n=2 Tax=Saccharopolyspora phatthalungensis TaxID=664693 RepID=A0A840Q0L2_9PSEU|nr:peptide/nickel transport system permease protein [Saccharopolyspora phatthalungensis]
MAKAVKGRARRRRLGPSFWSGAGILLAILVLSTWMSLWPLHDPLGSVGKALSGPSLQSPLGTDNLGRDTFTRLALAARTSLLISGAAALLGAAIGTVIGLIAGYVGGWVDSIIMRIVDAMLALPAILVALVVGVVIGNGPGPLIFALGLVFAPGFARVMRAPVIALRERDFVLAARLSGVHGRRVVIEHILPNVLTPLFVQFASVASQVVLIEAALSYLGQGVQAPQPSAGRMISEFTRFMQLQPLLIILPSLIIVLLSSAWNLLADGVQDYLAPRREPAFSLGRRGADRPGRTPGKTPLHSEEAEKRRS